MVFRSARGRARFLPKQVFKIERGAEAFIEAVRPLGIEISSVPRVNSNRSQDERSKPVRLDYRSYCTPAIMEIIRQRYARDFKLFGYVAEEIPGASGDGPLARR